jgi:hypothetical protein
VEGNVLKFTVQYLDAPHATVRYASELNAESAIAAEVSAKIGFRWAQAEHDACCYRVLDDSGAVVALGPAPDQTARRC